MKTEKELWERIDELGPRNLEWSKAEKTEWNRAWEELRNRFPLTRKEVLEFFRRQQATMTVLEIRREYSKLWEQFKITANEMH